VTLYHKAIIFYIDLKRTTMTDTVLENYPNGADIKSYPNGADIKSAVFWYKVTNICSYMWS
jgi:hypothetical protein